MARALLAAHIASGSAQFAQVRSQLAVFRHVAGCQPEYLRAIHIQLDTPDPLGPARLFQAGGGGAMTCGGTVVARIDAGLEMMLKHVALLSKNARRGHVTGAGDKSRGAGATRLHRRCDEVPVVRPGPA